MYVVTLRNELYKVRKRSDGRSKGLDNVNVRPILYVLTQTIWGFVFFLHYVLINENIIKLFND